MRIEPATFGAIARKMSHAIGQRRIIAPQPVAGSIRSSLLGPRIEALLQSDREVGRPGEAFVGIGIETLAQGRDQLLGDRLLERRPMLRRDSDAPILEQDGDRLLARKRGPDRMANGRCPASSSHSVTASE